MWYGGRRWFWECPSFVSLPSAAPQPVSRELQNSLAACHWSSPLSFRIMHDEVSETENIRKNLAIERMIIEGCEILLDTSQTFVRQGTVLLPPCPPRAVQHPVAPAVPAAPRSQPEPGTGSLPAGSLIQVPMSEKGKITRGRLGSLSLRKEGERQCFLFSKHLIICTRGSGGKLHLTKVGTGDRAWHWSGSQSSRGRGSGSPSRWDWIYHPASDPNSHSAEWRHLPHRLHADRGAGEH